ncbi:MAG: hypothetical protein M1822_002768 [Bathelium mastoideum]|nr:MAG: hypothetical protein M1822_002768 [Bathelium mastoideum]
MGVPKFFRWMSERYPAISQLIAENRIPEFDCLYLDMNGIIHNCTHNDADSPSHRMTEDAMFIAIFNYIEHLFAKIRPKKLFFMAVDGVAPRAKMNQQRSRRFRTALDAETARNKAIREGAEMPTEDPFDSNCITPGTEFMARLTKQLKYFINKKISEDVDWQGELEVVLSGHEVPGEGEHKIMEYIRRAKSQPDYDPNRRHCLYGLDADLIMLGLLSHDPHFCLLREEVTFGRQSKTKSKELEHQNFYLMHLCIVREYLELEFQELKEPGALGFEFDMERVIDDFILMAFFVGNDFLPNLPHLHINEGALALMFGVYKSVLPKAQGYINEGGVINLQRLALLLDELSHVEFRFFESENHDASWFKGKQLGKEDVMERTKNRGQIVMSSKQKELYGVVKTYVNNRPLEGETNPLDLPSSLPARDREFIKHLADSLHLQWNTLEGPEGERHMQLMFHPSLDGDDSDDDGPDEEAQTALLRVLKRYDNAKIVDVSAQEAQQNMEKKYEQKFQDWKDKYYKDKFEWGMDNEEEFTKLTENYVQGLQWVLFYYYRGVASWPWFFHYHYAPMISDVKKGLNANMNFELGQPFKPFQQLMGVLPDRSKKIVPSAFHELMTNENSPIIDFYPRDFQLDMNGKKMGWEAVVKIPFIEEDRLLSAMATKEHLLTDDEMARNGFGVSLKFTYKNDLDFAYMSSLPGVFPDLDHCKCVENIFELPTMEGLDVYVGLVDGVKLGVSALAGFPSLRTLPYTAALDFHGVAVFQQESRNESMVVTLTGGEQLAEVEYAKERLGKAVHVGYPFLKEAKVVRVSDELFDYVLPQSGPPAPIQIPHNPDDIVKWKKKADRIENLYSRGLGMIISPVQSLVHVQMLKGLKKLNDGSIVKEYADQPGIEPDYATQTIIDEVVSEDPRFIEKAALALEEDFPIHQNAFFLGEFNYGRPLQVTGHSNGRCEVWMSVVMGREREFGKEIAIQAERLYPYTPAFAVAKMLNLHPLVLSKLTSSFSVNSSGLRLNLGLNLKFEAKKMKVLGYSRKGATGWEYSQKAIDLIQQYMVTFPEFIAGIIRHPQGDLFNDTDFYPAEIAKDKMKEIGQWLKSVETKSFEKVPLEAEQLDSDVVQQIERAADDNEARGPGTEGKKILGVPRHALLKPGDAEQRIGAQRFALGDRVVHVEGSGRVPIALRGTVVGKTRTPRALLLDIVFDQTFMSGSTLGDRCSPFRGGTLASSVCLNLSDKQVVAMSRAQEQHQPQRQSQPLTVGGYGAPVQMGGQGRLVPAQQPAPLRGSFRGAVAGMQNGANPRGGAVQRGRGRGGVVNGVNGVNGYPPQQQMPIRTMSSQPNGFVPRGRANANGFAPRGGRGGLQPNRSGYTIVDDSNPADGVVPHNPNFRPQNYSSVPPPASLDAGRGRARGRARGPGVDRGNFRGRGRARGQVGVSSSG